MYLVRTRRRSQWTDGIVSNLTRALSDGFSNSFLVVTLLEPLKDQLEVLYLTLPGCQYPRNGQVFRPIRSLAGFTALKILSLGSNSIAPREVEKTFTENSKGFLVDILPRRSLGVLEILGVKSGALNGPLRELAGRSLLGEFPNLKYVRVLGDTHYYLKDGWKETKQAGRYHDLERLVPEKFRDKAQVRASREGHEMEGETRSLFQKAGVLFITVVVCWDPEEGGDGARNEGFVIINVQACRGGCGNKRCEDPENRQNRSPAESYTSA